MKEKHTYTSNSYFYMEHDSFKKIIIIFIYMYMQNPLHWMNDLDKVIILSSFKRAELLANYD